MKIYNCPTLDVVLFESREGKDVLLYSGMPTGSDSTDDWNKDVFERG